MNSVKRAMLYITRKKEKTFGLFLFLLAIAVFLILCFSVLNASKDLSRDIRSSFGAAFYLRASTSVSFDKNGEADIKENNICISQKEIERIMELGEIRYCNPMNYGFAKSDSLSFIPGIKHTKDSNMGKVTAIRFSLLAPEFADETAFLTAGRHITETDSGKILISEKLAEQNHLSVGDEIILTHARLGEKDDEYIDEINQKTAFAKVTISGLYQSDRQDAAMVPTADIAENQIYASLDVLEALQESEAGIYTGEVGFYITDPASLPDITRKVQLLPEIDWQTHFIRTNDFQYSRVQNHLASLGDLMKILLLCISAASTAILTLVLIMRIRGRMQEAGIFLAAGILKCHIIGQFLLEVLMTAVFAFICSFVIYMGIKGLLENCLFGEMTLNLINEQVLTEGMEKGRGTACLQMDWQKVMLLYFCQTVIVIASTLASSTVFMRLKPREIFSKIS